jgi:hypothetical protein
MLPLAFTHKMRYLSGQGMVSFIFLAALALDNLCKKKNWLLISFFVLFYLFNQILPNLSRENYATESSIYNPKYADEAAKIIKENSAPDDIIYSNFAYAAGMFSVLSHRATSTAMLAEVGPYRAFDQVKAAKLIVWLKSLDGKFPAKLTELIEKYKLEKIAETDLVYIYNNSNALGKKVVPKSTVPLWAINLILLVVVGVVAYDLTGKKIS